MSTFSESEMRFRVIAAYADIWTIRAACCVPGVSRWVPTLGGGA